MYYMYSYVCMREESEFDPLNVLADTFPFLYTPRAENLRDLTWTF